MKQAACAAHIYGKPVCQAEAFTSFGCDWIDDPWTMKDIGDEAFCHGLTRNVLCFWVHQPRLDAKPGFQWAHVGTHFDPQHHLVGHERRLADLPGPLPAPAAAGAVSWPISPICRARRFPASSPPRDKQQPLRPAGFDYDVLNAEVLLSRAAAKDGRLVLPDGMSYRYLVLPQRSPQSVSPRVLRKIKELAEGGVTVIGPRPTQAAGLTNYPQCDADVKTLADALWGSEQRKLGRTHHRRAASSGAARSTRSSRPTACRRTSSSANRAAQARLDWIHRRAGAAEIYFVSQPEARFRPRPRSLFRTAGKQPELWDAVTGKIRDLPQWRVENGRTVVPLEFAPRQSWFVVLPQGGQRPDQSSPTGRTSPRSSPCRRSPARGRCRSIRNGAGRNKVTFEKLDDWTTRPEEGIRYYSGTAVYRNQCQPARRSAPGQRIFLDLGAVKNVARVKLNGHDLGVVWTAPWHVEITGAIRAGVNDLEIEVVNLWPNRLIGDATLPPGEAIHADQRPHLRHDDQRHLRVQDLRAAQKVRPASQAALLGPAGAGNSADDGVR